MDYYLQVVIIARTIEVHVSACRFTTVCSKLYPEESSVSAT